MGMQPGILLPGISYKLKYQLPDWLKAYAAFGLTMKTLEFVFFFVGSSRLVLYFLLPAQTTTTVRGSACVCDTLIAAKRAVKSKQRFPHALSPITMINGQGRGQSQSQSRRGCPSGVAPVCLWLAVRHNCMLIAEERRWPSGSTAGDCRPTYGANAEFISNFCTGRKTEG